MCHIKGAICTSVCIVFVPSLDEETTSRSSVIHDLDSYRFLYDVAAACIFIEIKFGVKHALSGRSILKETASGTSAIANNNVFACTHGQTHAIINLRKVEQCEIKMRFGGVKNAPGFSCVISLLQ